MKTAPIEIAASVPASGPISCCGIAAGELEEHQIGRRIVEEGREHAGQPEIGDLVRRAVRPRDQRRAAARTSPSRPACSIASTGMMATKMPANRFATSRIGSQVKPFAARCSSGVSQSDSSAISDQRRVAHEVLQLDLRAVDVEGDAGLPRRRQQDGGDDQRDQHEVDPAADADAASARRDRLRGVGARADETRCRARRRSPSTHARRRSAVCSQRCCAVQKKSTPRRKPTNSGGSPSGVSAPPILATRMMKNTTTCALCAPLVVGADQRPDQDHRGAGGADELAIAVPKASMRGVGRAACRAGCR